MAAAAASGGAASKPEKSNKKVSRACNTCRLKRTKCDGQDPCFFCTETRNDCSYSREPRRRGPPSGYLRYVETRVSVLETFIGLFLTQSSSTSTTLSNLASRLSDDSNPSSGVTQDVWDAYRNNWLKEDANKILEQVVVGFTAFVRSEDHEGAASNSKPLLPPKGTVLANTSAKSGKSTTQELIQKDQPRAQTQPAQAQMPPAVSSPISIYFQPPPSLTPTESFERTRYDNSSSPPFSSQPVWPSSKHDDDFPFPGPEPGRNVDVMDTLCVATSSSSDADLRNVLPQSYTGSYWRIADALQQMSPSAQPFFEPPLADDIKLPPAHIISHLLDVYYSDVDPIFPFLPPRKMLDAIAFLPTTSSSTSITTAAATIQVKTEGNIAFLFALFAYTGHLSPSAITSPSSSPLVLLSPSSSSPPSPSSSSSASNPVADFWYMHARERMMHRLRSRSSLESVQTLLLCALRDQGKGYESQAWLLLGLAVRMGQDLGLHLDGNQGRKDARGKSLTKEEVGMRRQVWGVISVLDLYLSLQLGRPSAIHPSSADPSPSSELAIIGAVEHAAFAHTVSLCRIISRINQHLYLQGCITTGDANNTSKSESQSDTLLSRLKGELDAWYQALPVQFRMSIGHHLPREVMELNMLYHVAIILLYRPFCKNRQTQAAEVCLEAASTFNNLLSKYASSNSLHLSNPHLIYLIFTVASAHLSGHRRRENTSTVTTLQTQVHLMCCLDAFKSVGQTWELAGRCWRWLDRLMVLQKMKPGGNSEESGDSTLGKRKREIEGDALFSEHTHQRQSPLPMITTTAASSSPYDPSIIPPYSSRPPPFNFGSWSPSTVLSMSSSGTLSSAPPSSAISSSTITAESFFDPDFFPTSMAWMPDVSDAFDTSMWSSDSWNEALWTGSFQAPSLGIAGMGIGMGSIDGAREMGLGTGSLAGQ